MTKRALLQLLVPGRWVQVWWSDSSPTCGMILEKPDREDRGDVSLRIFYPDTGDVNSLASHTQIIGIGPGPNWAEINRMRFTPVVDRRRKLEDEFHERKGESNNA